ncbi:cytochrome P450 [uncultured Aeromicrobium sp.]|uniref:cytochrome P450 n=1 Tax=uncultured Aeromicrobium sp. TaxID=337820 RepID=UPI0025FB7D52|nr:cytochrome P450 [uncultured Aeromicrobium sp.]
MAVRNDWSGHTFEHPPGRVPIAGDARHLRTGTPLSNVMRLAPAMGDIFEIRVFGQKFVFVQGAELAAELCDERRFRKALSPALEALREFVGDALFTADDGEPNWQRAHDLLMPAFTKEAMRGYHDTMLATAREMFAVWDAGPGPVDVTADMTRLTMETISRTAFSRDFGSFTSRQVHPFVRAMIAALTTGMRKSSLGTVPGGKRIARRIDAHNAHHLAYVDRLVDDLITERRAGGKEHGDLLDLMLTTAHPETGERLDDVNIRHQILTFLVAGHETTSGALSFSLYYLSRHREVLERAQAETDAILGADPDAEPTFEQVPKFRYLRRVLDEALRLWPTAPAFARSPRADTMLAGAYPMTPDDWALIILPLTHRDARVWGGDAERFDPDRFLSANSRGRAKNVYKPFGTGERACIGRQFALHEALLVLARILHRYEISGDPAYDLDIDERLTVVPKGFALELRRRFPVPVDRQGGGDGGDIRAGRCPTAH